MDAMARRGKKSGGKIKNWSRVQSKERITNLDSNQGYDKEIIGYWKHDKKNATVVVRKNKTPGQPAKYKVLVNAGRRSKKIASGSAGRNAGGLTSAPKLTQAQAMKKARRWMRKHPNP